MADNKKTPKASKPENASAKKETVKKDTAKKDAPKKDAAKKPNAWSKVKQFFKDVKGETKKIVWNSWPDTIKDTGVVFLVTLVVGSGVWIFDVLFRQLIELIYSLA